MTAQRTTHDTSVVKLDSSRSPRGPAGEKYLASGVRVAMRLWEAEPPSKEDDPDELEPTERDYEVVGYIVAGRAELHLEGQIVLLEPGSSYVVPRGARHFYRVLETLTAVEATSPPAHVHGRDSVPAPARRRAIDTDEADADELEWRPSGSASHSPGAGR